MTNMLVLLNSAVVVDVEDPRDAPEQAIELYKESLTDQGMMIRFECRWLDANRPGYIVVGGEVVGTIP